MTLAFRPATPADIPLLRGLAERIWRVSYAAMLSLAQIDHMLGWMYGADTIAAEMAAGTRWIVAEAAGAPVGYLALSLAGRTAELHKLYLLPDRQGGGLGQRMLAHAKVTARAGGCDELRLRVNKTNARALRAYERAGFRVVDALVADIGGGFVMDDYVLAVSLAYASPLAAKSRPLVKTCGLSTAETMDAALEAGADWVGLVFFPKSPRHVSLAQAEALAERTRGRAAVVALTVDAADEALDAIVSAARPDRLQLHGSETPARVEAVKARYGLPVMKAIGVSTAADLARAEPYRGRADILFDAKPPKGAVLPGGNGAAFDWDILRGYDGPFILSGGLTPANVGEALRRLSPVAVDVSSGVETAPGVKDPARIAAFVREVRRSD